MVCSNLTVLLVVDAGFLLHAVTINAFDNPTNQYRNGAEVRTLLIHSLSLCVGKTVVNF